MNSTVARARYFVRGCQKAACRGNRCGPCSLAVHFQSVGARRSRKPTFAARRASGARSMQYEDSAETGGLQWAMPQPAALFLLVTGLATIANRLQIGRNLWVGKEGTGRTVVALSSPVHADVVPTGQTWSLPDRRGPYRTDVVPTGQTWSLPDRRVLYRTDARKEAGDDQWTYSEVGLESPATDPDNATRQTQV
jgi:hypothetical protein